MDAKPGWYRTFFEGPTVAFWLRAMPAEVTEREADFVVEALGVRPGARLLDVPCGGGRHALALAARGFAVTGVDLSAAFLDAARAGAAERALPVAWEHREMRDLPWAAAFDGASCLGNSFGYLDEGENLAFLRAVAGTLRAGSRFVLDTSYVAESLLPTLQERAWYPQGDGHCLAERRYDPDAGRLHVAYTFLDPGQSPTTHVMSARLHTVREVRAMLAEAGFTALETFGGLDREPFRLGSPRLVAVATKGQED